MAVDYPGLAETYDATRSSPKEVMEFWVPTVVLLADVRANSRVLDVGCGTGRISAPLADQYRVVGVDASREMLVVARAKGSRAAFVLGDAARLPFVDRSFKAAIAVIVLHLLPDFRRATREMARVAPRGVIATINMQARAKHAIDEAFPSLQGIDAARFPRVSAIEGACREAGWTDTEVHEARRRVESSTREFLERVRERYLSTLSLLPPGEFERGLAWLEEELPRRGERYAYDHTVTFVVASR